MRDSTKIILSTLSRSVPGEPLHSGPVFAAPYHTPGDPSDTPYSYARSHNPTWTSLEKAIGQMESGEGSRASGLVFASGMAACAAAVGAVRRPGDRTQRSSARPRSGARHGTARTDRSMANVDRSGPGTDGGVAGVAFHRHAALAARTLLRECPAHRGVSRDAR